MERLQLDPKIQSFWASPTELRFGIDTTLTTLDDPPARVERLIDALRGGMPASHLPHIAKAFGVSAREREDLIAALEPVILRTVPSSSPTDQQVSLALDGPEEMRSTLTPLFSTPEFLARTDAAVQVALVLSHFVTPMTQARFWATRGIPHLQVLFSERQVRIGPFAGVEGNACLLCLQLHLTDREPSWPAMASQCLGRRAATVETSFLAVTAGVTLSLLRDWVRERQALVGQQIVIERDDQRGFTLRSEVLTPHERCDCQQLLS